MKKKWDECSLDQAQYPESLLRGLKEEGLPQRSLLSTTMMQHAFLGDAQAATNVL